MQSLNTGPVPPGQKRKPGKEDAAESGEGAGDPASGYDVGLERRARSFSRNVEAGESVVSAFQKAGTEVTGRYIKFVNPAPPLPRRIHPVPAGVSASDEESGISRGFSWMEELEASHKPSLNSGGHQLNPDFFRRHREPRGQARPPPPPPPPPGPAVTVACEEVVSPPSSGPEAAATPVDVVPPPAPPVAHPLQDVIGPAPAPDPAPMSTTAPEGGPAVLAEGPMAVEGPGEAMVEPPVRAIVGATPLEVSVEAVPVPANDLQAEEPKSPGQGVGDDRSSEDETSGTDDECKGGGGGGGGGGTRGPRAPARAGGPRVAASPPPAGPRRTARRGSAPREKASRSRPTWMTWTTCRTSSPCCASRWRRATRCGRSGFPRCWGRCVNARQ
jgi:hypothetical protein